MLPCVCRVHSIYRVELAVETNGGVYPRGIPYIALSNAARPHSRSRGVTVRDSDSVREPMAVQHKSSAVLSRSFFVRYSEESFDVNDTAVFQLEKVRGRVLACCPAARTSLTPVR